MTENTIHVETRKKCNRKNLTPRATGKESGTLHEAMLRARRPTIYGGSCHQQRCHFYRQRASRTQEQQRVTVIAWVEEDSTRRKSFQSSFSRCEKKIRSKHRSFLARPLCCSNQSGLAEHSLAQLELVL